MDEALPDVEKGLSEVEPQLPGVVHPEDDQGERDEDVGVYTHHTPEKL